MESCHSFEFLSIHPKKLYSFDIGVTVGGGGCLLSWRITSPPLLEKSLLILKVHS